MDVLVPESIFQCVMDYTTLGMANDFVMQAQEMCSVLPVALTSSSESDSDEEGVSL